MITRAVEYLVNQLIDNDMIEETQREDYYYSLECFLEGVVTTTSILILALCFQNLLPTITFLIFFFSLRKRTGGFHLDTFKGCYIGTLVLYVCVSILSIIIVNKMIFLACLTISAYIFILMIGTVNHPNMDMSREELEAAKVSSRLMVSLLMILIVFLWWIGIDIEIIVYMCMAVILCGSLLLLAKIIKQEVKTNG